MDLLTLWVMLTLPNLGQIALVTGLLALLISGLGVAFFIAIGYMDDEPKAITVSKKITKIFLIPSILAVFLGAIIPDKEGMKYIVGGYVVTNIEGIEKLPPNLVNAANKFLEDYKDKEEEKPSE